MRRRSRAELAPFAQVVEMVSSSNFPSSIVRVIRRHQESGHFRLQRRPTVGRRVDRTVDVESKGEERSGRIELLPCW